MNTWEGFHWLPIFHSTFLDLFGPQETALAFQRHFTNHLRFLSSLAQVSYERIEAPYESDCIREWSQTNYTEFLEDGNMSIPWPYTQEVTVSCCFQRSLQESSSTCQSGSSLDTCCCHPLIPPLWNDFLFTFLSAMQEILHFHFQQCKIFSTFPFSNLRDSSLSAMQEILYFPFQRYKRFFTYLSAM